jgi:hypothetical protein
VTHIRDATATQYPGLRTRICDAIPRLRKQGHHHVRIEGHSELVLTLECEDASGNHAGGGNAATAARIVNAIPWLCEQKPGLVSGADLPLIPGHSTVGA